MAIKRLSIAPKIITGGALYPYSEELYAMGARETIYEDAYNIFTVIGAGAQKRILVPRNMAPWNSETNYSEGFDVHFKSLFKPRNTEQSRIIAESVDLLQSGTNFITECPTGFGKTACAMDVIAKLKKKTLVVVTKEDIRDQWVDAGVKFLGLSMKDIGVIQAEKFQITGKKLVIALVHSLAKEDRYPAHQFREFGLAIWDEVHRVGADFFAQSCFRIPAVMRWGLSARADRKDGRLETIEAHIGPVRVKTTMANMVPRVVARQSPWQIPLTSVIDSKTGKAKVAPIPHSPSRCGHVINMICNCHPRNVMLSQFTAAAYKKGRICLFQSDRKEHLDTIYMMLQQLGVPPGVMSYYVGGMDKAQREYAKTKPIILSTYQMTAEATDIPQADTLIMGTPKSDILQIVGRVLREYQGKQQPLLFDVIDSTSNVFAGYWNSRRTYYASIGAEVNTVPHVPHAAKQSLINVMNMVE
jgi:superfamily II DNA or RNA helicase